MPTIIPSVRRSRAAGAAPWRSRRRSGEHGGAQRLRPLAGPRRAGRATNTSSRLAGAACTARGAGGREAPADALGRGRRVAVEQHVQAVPSCAMLRTGGRRPARRAPPGRRRPRPRRPRPRCRASARAASPPRRAGRRRGSRADGSARPRPCSASRRGSSCPAAASPKRLSQNSRRLCGSTPRSARRGAAARARASSRRRARGAALPAAQRPGALARTAPSPYSAISAATRCAARRRAEAEDPRHELEVLVHGEVVVQREALGHVAERRRSCSASRGISRPSTSRCPRSARAARTACGSSSTCRSRSGRGSRRCRRGTARSTPSTATTSPKRRVSPRAGIAGCAFTGLPRRRPPVATSTGTPVGRVCARGSSARLRRGSSKRRGRSAPARSTA